MDQKQELLELYKEFIYTKENFVNRSFATNKFYIVALTICLFIIAALKEYAQVVNSLANTSGSFTFMAVALAGMIFSILLWANQDAYAYLIKIKFKNVIDKMEEQFCFQPCIQEKEAIIEQAKKKRNYIFTDFQKAYALVAMTIFLAIFLGNLVTIAISSWAPVF